MLPHRAQLERPDCRARPSPSHAKRPLLDDAHALGLHAKYARLAEPDTLLCSLAVPKHTRRHELPTPPLELALPFFHDNSAPALLPFDAPPPALPLVAAPFPSSQPPPSLAAPGPNTMLGEAGLFVRRRTDGQIARLGWDELQEFLGHLVTTTALKPSSRRRKSASPLVLQNGHPWRQCQSYAGGSYGTKAQSGQSPTQFLDVQADDGLGWRVPPPYLPYTRPASRRLHFTENDELDADLPISLPSPPNSSRGSLSPSPQPAFRMLRLEGVPVGTRMTALLVEGERRRVRLEEDDARRTQWEARRRGAESYTRGDSDEEEKNIGSGDAGLGLLRLAGEQDRELSIEAEWW